MATENEGSNPAPNSTQSFWATIPGMLAALGGVLVAIAGLARVLGEYGLLGSKDTASPPKGIAVAPLPTALTSTTTPQEKTPSTTRLRGELLEVIRTQQALYIRASWGVEASQNFSAADLEEFHSKQMRTKIADELKADPRFQALALAIRLLPATERDNILRDAATNYRSTWIKIGKIDPLGQTEAGQQAERELAEAIVKLVRRSR